MTTHLERELHEQPAALERLLDRQREGAERIAALLRRPDVDYVLIASRGSSANAARYAQYVLGRAHRVPVSFATPSLYTIYGQPPRLAGALVVGISQSGRSPDVTEVLEEARRQNRPTVAITNDTASPLAAAADEVLALEAGEEVAVAATKTYVNSLGAVALLFAVATGDAAALAELERVPSQLALQLERSRDDVRRLDLLEDLHGGTVVARGINYATAFEIALKIRELSGLLFEAYSAADLMHGPIAAVGAGWPVLAVAPRGPAFAAMGAALDALHDRGARLVVVSDDAAALRRAHVSLPLWTRVPEWLSPLVAVVPGQLAALRLAQLRGVDVDAPLGLSKVTLTR
ncbi:MAG TPA: SIS domain-containing protein [Gaiellaceae bacterium]|nr:SIS domain-containing protein [Gaiellaceae bacterium]